MESGHNPQLSGEVEAYWYFRKCTYFLLSAQICFRETGLKAVALSYINFQALHYLFLCCYSVFPYRSLAFLWKIMDLLFTISYRCSIVSPRSKLRTIGEVSAFLNKMLANINADIDLFCRSICFICALRGTRTCKLPPGIKGKSSQSANSSLRNIL